MSAIEVAKLLRDADITLTEVRKAVYHLTKPERADLYDEASPNQKSAAGKFFEALVYEILLKESKDSAAVEKIAAKLADAEYVPYDKYAPDGLWYSRDGEIRFRIDGRVAAEVDFLVRTSDGVLVFGEAAAAKTKGFAAELAKKKMLLCGLYHCPVQALVVLPHKRTGGFACLEEGDAYAVVEGDEAYRLVLASEVLKRNLSPTECSKRVNGKDI
ncbi:MAG TPA: hypothetical protein O0X39_08370 [Methanocorpusculum sp.]|nr:hypothetical protein [Methanocorpusculum sp.]